MCSSHMQRQWYRRRREEGNGRLGARRRVSGSGPAKLHKQSRVQGPKSQAAPKWLLVGRYWHEHEGSTGLGSKMGRIRVRSGKVAWPRYDFLRCMHDRRSQGLVHPGRVWHSASSKNAVETSPCLPAASPAVACAKSRYHDLLTPTHPNHRRT